MSVREYIGARYVPLFAEPLEWTNTIEYEPLTIVLHEGNSYTSRQFVPIGIDIANEQFWALTGNYNAQIEQYRQEVKALANKVKLMIRAFSTFSDAQAALAAGTLGVGEWFQTSSFATGDANGAVYFISATQLPISVKMTDGAFAAPFIDQTMNVGVLGITSTEDIGTRLTAVIAALPNGVDVVLPKASYSFMTPIKISGTHSVYGEASLTAKASNVPAILAENVSDMTISGLSITLIPTDYVNTSNTSLVSSGGIGLINATNVTIEGCTLTNYAVYGVRVSGTSNSVVVKNNVFNGISDSSIIPSQGNYNYAVQLIHGSSGTTEGNIQYSSISGNFIQGGAHGISIGCINSNTEIHDNTVKNTIGQHGIYVQSAQGMTISNNFIDNCALDSIKVQSDDVFTTVDDVIVSDNIVKGGQVGVRLTTSSATNTVKKAVVQGNIFEDSITGAYIAGCDDALIIGNRISSYQGQNIATFGVRVTGVGSSFASSKKVTIMANYIEKADYSLINVSGDMEEINIIGNYVANGGNVSASPMNINLANSGFTIAKCVLKDNVVVGGENTLYGAQILDSSFTDLFVSGNIFQKMNATGGYSLRFSNPNPTLTYYAGNYAFNVLNPPTTTPAA